MPSVKQLSRQNLDLVSDSVIVPNYEPTTISTGIIHLGVGNFHRAHQAVYTDDVLGRGDLDWGIVGISLRSPRIREAMQPQDFLYSVNFQGSGSETIRVVGSIREVLCAPDNPQHALDLLCDPDIKIVTLTITEKGYVWHEADEPSWEVAAFHRYDASALLYLVEALYQRRERGITPFTILSCDNLASNGKKVRSAVLSLARKRDAAFAAYLEDVLACPSSMVDRIVPQPTDEDFAKSQQALGLEDNAAITTEPFGQWVIEDDFPTGRPDWSSSEGVVFADDVTPFEDMKLRLLNGAHTFIALYGQLADRIYVSDVMNCPSAMRFLDLFWKQAIKTIDIDYDLAQYTQTLDSRFRNENLFHQTAQIATDTSQKLPQRIVEPLLVLKERGLSTVGHSTVVALWFEYVRRFSNIADPLEAELKAASGDSDIVSFVRKVSIFPEVYFEDDGLMSELKDLHTRLVSAGLDAFLDDLCGS